MNNISFDEVSVIGSFANPYNYKYNGKELQDELGLNMYDYGARNYDPALGRWMNIDNLSEKYFSLSPYHYAGNNPVLYLDVDGNEFTEDAWKWVNSLIADINSRQEKNNSSIADYKAKIAEGGSDRQIARWNRNINSLTANNAELETTRGETATLAASDQIYDVQNSNSLSDSNSSIAGTGFNFSNGNVVILMPSNAKLDLFSHELKHAFQFEIGETGFLTRESFEKGIDFLHDKTDEVNGYNRGVLFGGDSYGIKNLPIEYNNLPTGPLNATTNPQISSALQLAKEKQKTALQKVANNLGAAFRVDKTTYYKH